MKFTGLLLIVLGFICQAFASIKVNTDSHAFVDENKRTLIFHGVNAVYKIAPWHPATTGYDSTSTLSSTDAANLKDWGFNVVRLGVMWPGVEPGARGAYNQTYLDQIETIVKNLAKEDIYVVLDLHQDLLHRKYCGEGVPDYVYNICKSAQPAETRAFPLPAVNASYPVDSDGNPTLDACLSEMFATYYLTDEVGAAFQCLYDNVDGLWDALAGYWTTVAKRFSTFNNVIGYELLNEPWAGNVFEHPKSILPHYAELNYLQPLYQYLHSRIREVDDDKIIFYEGLTIDYWPNGFTEAPGPAAYNDRQVLAYHIYCPAAGTSKKQLLACDAIDDLFFNMRNKDVARLGGGMMMTEFGASEDTKTDLYVLKKVAGLADKHAQSWMYWQLKYYEDLTTCTPVGESLYTAEGVPCEDKLRVLSRTYPMAVAGGLVGFEYSVETGLFQLEYSPLSTVVAGTSSNALTTLVYLNHDLMYSNGFHLSVTLNGEDVPLGDSASAISVSCPSIREKNYVKLIQNAGTSIPDAATVKVNIRPCVKYIPGVCTCK